MLCIYAVYFLDTADEMQHANRGRGYERKDCDTDMLCGIKQDEEIRWGLGASAWCVHDACICAYDIMCAGVTDPSMEKLARYRRSTSGKKGKNASRDFYRYIHRDDKVFHVDVSYVRLVVKRKKPNKSGRKINQEIEVDYPVIHFSSWLRSVLHSCPQFFLGGFGLDDIDQWGDMFELYWNMYAETDEGHPINRRSREDKRRTIPLALHGDEGRGLAKVPLLVQAFQVVIPHNGPNELNIKKHLVSLGNVLYRDSLFVFFWSFVQDHLPRVSPTPRHSFTSRLLYSLLPSTWYASKDRSTDGLNRYMMEDLTKMFEDGLEIAYVS